MSFVCGFLHVLPKISCEDYRRLSFDEITKRFFKATITSEEKSVTESTDNTEKQRNLISHSESEGNEEINDEDEDEETLEEKINRLALESSDEDEDFDVSNRDITH